MLFELLAELLARDRFWMVGEYLLPLCLAKPGLEVKVLFVNAMEDGGAPEKVCVWLDCIFAAGARTRTASSQSPHERGLRPAR